MNKPLLLIFAKNPVLNRVKTRLAKDIGAVNALKIYRYLLNYTRDITQTLTVSKALYYSDFIPTVDDNFDATYTKRLQTGDDLGERMYTAFDESFKAGFTDIIIIGSDSHELTQAIIEQAFLQLKTADFVIGPAVDGGYYLLGMKTLARDIFEGKTWSTATVFSDTVKSIKRLNMTYALLPKLRDVDTVDDLGSLSALIEGDSE